MGMRNIATDVSHLLLQTVHYRPDDCYLEHCCYSQNSNVRKPLAVHAAKICRALRLHMHREELPILTKLKIRELYFKADYLKKAFRAT